MKKRIKRIAALVTLFSLITSLFYGCDDENGNANNEMEQQEQIKYKLSDLTTEEITLNYYFWQDIEISEKLEKEFEAMYPNIEVVLEQMDISYTDDLHARAVVGELPDCFWILGSPDSFIENGFLFDMSLLWKYDPDARNVIKGINEFDLGNYGTVGMWTIPVKFFPTLAFVNLDVFNRNGVEMPSMDWTWNEFEDTVEKMTREDKETGKHIFGVTGNCGVVTWYPLASDKECIGEFGWNGTVFDMENWVYGMNLEAKWVQNENKPYELYCGGEEQLKEMYDSSVYFPEDIGYSAIHTSYWWNWEDYYNTKEWTEENKVIFVPYIMPHTENAQGGNYIAIMDKGAISAYTKYPREAYELLKFMTWGTEGWKYKLKYYPDLLEESANDERPVSKNNCPITLDEDIWNEFIKWHPNTETGDNYMTELYGEEYDRAKYFEYFLNTVKKSTWTCYGGQQIPGFDTWLQNVYYGKDGQHDYGYAELSGIEAACIYGNTDAKEYYEYLQKQGNRISKEKLEEISKLIE